MEARRQVRRSTPRHRALRRRSLYPSLVLVVGLVVAVVALSGLLGSDEGSGADRDRRPAATPTTPGDPSLPLLDARVGTERADPMEAVEISGRLSVAPPGTAVQVQQRQRGRWRTFPLRPAVDASGAFSTYVELARPGLRELRVVELRTGATSQTLVVRVG